MALLFTASVLLLKFLHDNAPAAASCTQGDVSIVYPAFDEDSRCGTADRPIVFKKCSEGGGSNDCIADSEPCVAFIVSQEGSTQSGTESETEYVLRIYETRLDVFVA